MNNNTWRLLFGFVLLADLVAAYRGDEAIRFFSKPMIMIVLSVYFYRQTVQVTSFLKKWILLAFFFSWCGDVLLLFESKEPVFFLLGLAAFLVAHVFYIIFFHAIRIRENVRGNFALLIAVVVYYTGFMILLSPYLGEWKLAVRIYGVVISFMLMLALHTGFIRHRAAAGWMISGALLFILSDSLLALNKFYASFPFAGIAVMFSYGMAQLCLTEGAIRYITHPKTN